MNTANVSRPLRFPNVIAALLCVVGLAAGCQKPTSGAPSQMPPVQVVAIAAKQQPVSETLSAIGTVTANEIVEIKSETDGTIEEILFEEGQQIKKGQLLLKLDETKLAAAVAEAEANFRLSKATFERTEQLFKGKLISQQEFDQAASAYALNEATLQLKKRDLKDTRIYAPFAGMIGARNISPGQVISKNSSLIWLVSYDPVKVEFNIPERFLGQVQINQTLAITVAAYNDRQFDGKVFFISPYIDTTNRTALIKAQVPNPKNDLKPGMFANLDLTLKIRDKAIVIPEAALFQLLDQDRARLFIVGADNTAQLREVKLGVHLPGRVEILSGVRAGEKVIVEGLQKIGPGSKVQLAPAEASKPYET